MRHVYYFRSQCVLVIFFLFSSTSLFGWGRDGHIIINGSFTANYPIDSLWFARFTSYYVAHASDADNRRVTKSVYGPMDEYPRHYIDIDYYPEFYSSWFPHDLDSLITKYGSSTVYDHGILPWTIKIDYDSLVTFLKNGDTTNANRVIADLGHYIGDAYQPLHCTDNYNPKGVHSRYESTMIRSYLSQILISPDTAVYIDDVLDYAFRVIYKSNSKIQMIFAADDSATTAAGNTTSDLYYQIMWSMLDSMTISQLRGASISLASLVYSAWRDATVPADGVVNTVTIAQARQDLDRDLIPDYSVTGDTLKVYGIVTTPNLLTGNTGSSYFVQDATAGINVNTSAGTLSFQIGDSVAVVGTILQYKGLTEIQPLAADSAHFGCLKHNAVIPQPKHVTLHQYLQNAESYEGLLIEIDTLYKAAGAWGSGLWIYLMNASHTDTTALYIFASTDIGGAEEPQYPVDIIGVVSQSGLTDSTGYFIVPHDSTDIWHITVTNVNNKLSGIPKDLYLNQNYPNPFNPSTTIIFGAPKAAQVQIAVYNVLGQRVAVLIDGMIEAGNHQVVFNGGNFASGVYFCLMRTDTRMFKEKMLMLK